MILDSVIFPMAPLDDVACMHLALQQARLAAEAGEVPVGAVVVHEGCVIGVGRNAPIASHDPTAHAEIAALRAAAQARGNYRLEDCDLYVTLEPCVMCSGAMLHSRLRRVVFGAHDPKTGAAGSVLNLFDSAHLNHQTQVKGGVLATECGALLSDFFRSRREQKRQVVQPLREDALRTADSFFLRLPDYPWMPRYLNDLPSLQGLRMHYLDEGPRTASRTWLCLHGNPTWSYVYRHMIPVFLAAGDRVVAPDLVGFGRSDKPKRESAHAFRWHRQVLLEFIERLDLQRMVMVVQDWGGLLGMTLPMDLPGRVSGLLAMNTMLATGDVPLSPGFLAWREMVARKPDFSVSRLMARSNPHLKPAECAAYEAPFPDRGHRAALRAFPAMVPEHPDDDGADISRRAREYWASAWTGQSMMAIGLQDPVLGESVMRRLQSTITNCDRVLVLPQAGHFVQEHGREIAMAACEHFQLPGALPDA